MKKLNHPNRTTPAGADHLLHPASKSPAGAMPGRSKPKQSKKHSVIQMNAETSNEPQDIIKRREAKLREVEKRKARSRTFTMFGFVLIIMILTVFIIMTITKETAPKPRFMFLQTGTLEHFVGSTGLLIRSETVMNSPASGTVHPLAEEGNRIAFGQDIAVIIGEGKEETLAALENCKQQISELQRELINDGKGPGARVIYDETDEDIAELVNLIRKDSIQGTLLDLNSYETSISVLLERRDTRLLSIDFNDSRLSELKVQKDSLENSLGIHSGTIVSQIPGIVSYHIDGLEGLLTIPAADTLTVEQYSQYIKESKVSVTTEDIIGEGSPIVRITGGIYQCIAFLLPDTSIAAFPDGSIHTIKIPMDGTTIENCKVLRTMISGTDLFIVFQTDRQLTRFSDRRTIQADITTRCTEGLKIPFSSIIGFDEETRTGKIMIISDGYARTTQIRVLDHDREYAIVEGIEGEQYQPVQNGYLVKNPDSMTEGENIGDVNQ